MEKLRNTRAGNYGHGIRAEHGPPVSLRIATPWRFFAWRKVTLNKRPGMQRSRIVPS